MLEQRFCFFCGFRCDRIKADRREKFAQHRSIERFIVYHQNLAAQPFITDYLRRLRFKPNRGRRSQWNFKSKRTALAEFTGNEDFTSEQSHALLTDMQAQSDALGY